MTLLIQCTAAFAIVAFGLSVMVGGATKFFESSLDALAPKAQARVYLVAVVLPGLLAAILLAAALAPAFGWIADHCVTAVDLHQHPHICAHHVAAWPALTIVVLALLVVARLTWVVGRQSYALMVGRRARREFDRLSTIEDGVRVLPLEAPRAFVLGLFRPTLYVTKGLVSGPNRLHFDAVIAHESAHLVRHDSWRRFVAAFALAFHLPGLAHRLEHALARAQEMAADDVAAKRVGRECVARALVALARFRIGTPAMALSFTGSDLEVRVRRLMDARPRSDSPTPFALVVGAVVTLAIVAGAADSVHHAVEMILGVLGG